MNLFWYATTTLCKFLLLLLWKGLNVNVFILYPRCLNYRLQNYKFYTTAAAKDYTLWRSLLTELSVYWCLWNCVMWQRIHRESYVVVGSRSVHIVSILLGYSAKTGTLYNAKENTAKIVTTIKRIQFIYF